MEETLVPCRVRGLIHILSMKMRLYVYDFSGGTWGVRIANFGADMLHGLTY